MLLGEGLGEVAVEVARGRGEQGGRVVEEAREDVANGTIGKGARHEATLGSEGARCEAPVRGEGAKHESMVGGEGAGEGT